ncbi:hypothetical protein K3N28_22905 [Glycomyces sp. TRM65418]|uniref:DUF7144 family membrane protein n=1 Tax=Glycomyces sp. TRM65418 TaxID=2867006 RepID=UPI001CE4BF74|nr:hypothetical protein [Glycomyces sp. TRM65418]MCC3765913.1 hypothetical protein [Glycomyces sp. TRM65418]QZD55495.1 hypothetical protein K3N28_22780 [Glycomyces sp. TRM65418]
MTDTPKADTGKVAWATAGAVFAGGIMLTVGLFQLFEGIAAIAEDELFVSGADYTFAIDTAGWGWIHLILGALVALVGVFVLMGRSWAFGAGIGLAIVSALNQFFFLPYYPWWALLIIALDVFVIWSLACVLAEVNTVA